MNILLAWEVGRNFGHVTQLVELARALRMKNKRVKLSFALQNPSALLPFAQDLKYTLLQAPSHLPRPMPQLQARGASQLYSDDLMPCGYYDPLILAGLIQSWQDMFALVKPDALITQAAPTALIASGKSKFKRFSFGGGYDVPALSSPMPALRYWETQNPEELAAREAQALDTVNKALEMLKKPEVKSFAKALHVHGQYLTTFEELDHYPERATIEGRAPAYHGAFFSLESGEKLSWDKKAEQRVFAYIRPEGAGFEACLNVMARLPETIDRIVSAPGIDPQARQALQRPGLRIIDGPVKLSTLIKKCDIAINHASQGIGSAFALHGVPQLLLPSHIEQLMFAKALGRQKLGRGLAGRYGPEKIAEVLSIILQDPQYKDSAKDFAKRYKDFKPEHIAQDIAADILKVMKG